MPGKEIAEYGVAVFAIAGLIYVLTKFLDKFLEKKKDKDTDIAEVIKNNTKALEQVTTVVQAIQLSLTRLEAKTDELLERARR